MSLVARAVLAPPIILALARWRHPSADHRLRTHPARRGPAKLVIFAVLAVVELAVVVPALGRAADAAFGAGEAVTSAQQSTATAASTVALILVITAASLGGSNPAAHAGA